MKKKKKDKTVEYRQCFRIGNKNKVHNHHHHNNKSSNWKAGQQEPGPEQYCVLAVYRNESGWAWSLPAEMLTELRKTTEQVKRWTAADWSGSTSMLFIQARAWIWSRGWIETFSLIFCFFSGVSITNNNEKKHAAAASVAAQRRPVGSAEPGDWQSIDDSRISIKCRHVKAKYSQHGHNLCESMSPKTALMWWEVTWMETFNSFFNVLRLQTLVSPALVRVDAAPVKWRRLWHEHIMMTQREDFHFFLCS